MVEFVGRRDELATLERELQKVSAEAGGERPGRCVMLRGRRRVGKSRLVERFAERSGVPFLFYAATGASAADDLARLAQDAQASNLPLARLMSAAQPQNWDAAFDVLAAALPTDQPSVLVIDEVPYLMDEGGAFEGMLQRAWDRALETKPVLLILIGSDLSMMEALNSYGRPFHQRGREMVLGPLNPAEVGCMLGLEAAEAFDAALVTGGLPLICADWPRGASLWDFLDEALNDPVSPLLVSAERSLAAEFPPNAQPRRVLAAIGSGERTFTNIARAAGGIAATSLQRSLEILVDKRIVAGDEPLSTRPSKERRYRVTDSYLRFWLHLVGPYIGEIERGRGDLTLARIRDAWTSWRGRAIEPLIREALARILPDDKLPEAPAVGGYWTRSNSVEIDIVGADRAPIAKELRFVGSIKWLERSPFDQRDLAALHRHRAALTDEPVPLLAVSRSGVDCSGLDACYGPADLLNAWPL
ncbi:ATP-binding protein [Saccharopolyspora mangrovi]|uniref:ATP-binding protein n=1 Tax=Saccharopolyspora mangrovi TaxID=3082379 RepID=A0ABU6A389_9PSEU|nr:ATP-binding protein [Saccharopolyspora sp. S2-29]MEB3366037.1 ATP-binding protein [Saccharopolyspora sp. S2-29]